MFTIYSLYVQSYCLRTLSDLLTNPRRDASRTTKCIFAVENTKIFTLIESIPYDEKKIATGPTKRVLKPI